MIADGGGRSFAPGAILLEDDRIEASGTPQQVGDLECPTLDLPDSVVLPALVNAHTHLDLTHLGPRPVGASFADWADSIRKGRCIDERAIADSVQRGIELSRRGGSAIVGDIAGGRSRAPIHALRASGMAGVSYAEVFGLGLRQPLCVAFMQQLVREVPARANGVALGLQPHAPYSCGLEVYRAAAALGVPLATHLAETLEEIEFVARATGPLADMIRRIGVWDPTIAGTGAHPVDHLLKVLNRTAMVAAHLNYIDARHLPLLAASRTTVAYCPRASAYFGHPNDDHGPHRYRQMMSAGINVALGTDSIVCLDREDRLSVLDEMRLLHRRDGTDPALLLRMATTNGARALGFDPQLVAVAPGPTAGLLAIRCDRKNGSPTLSDVLANDETPQWVAGPFAAHDSWMAPCR